MGVKSKVRFDGLDVAAMVAHWNKVALGRRVINIYNGPNGETYLFKLDKLQSDKNSNNNDNNKDNNNKSGASTNMMLLIESGIRFHATQQPYDNPGMPSQFCAKLRKHLRGLRLEVVQQLGNKDRVINLIFGSGEKQRHSLIIELYARGNIILTNSQYQILSLLRSHEYNTGNDNPDSSNTNVKVKVGHAYPITYATTATTTTTTSAETDTDSNNDILLNCDNPMEWYQSKIVAVESAREAENATKAAATAGNNKSSKKKKKDQQGNPWRVILAKSESGVSHYGPSLIDHCLTCANMMTTNPKELDSDQWKALQSILQTEGTRILSELDMISDKKGYILYQPKKNKDSNNKGNGEDAKKDSGDNKKEESSSSTSQDSSEFKDKILMEFQPHLLKQHEHYEYILTYDSFNDAVDAFFSHLESQKMLIRAETQQAAAEQRLAKIKLDQQQRIDALQEQQEVLRKEAELVELHAGMIEKAIQVVNSALDSGMDWDQLEDLVEVEQTQNQNPVALLIHKLELADDAMVLKLATEEYMHEPELADEDEDGEPTTMNIRISLKETAHGNASALFAKYRNSKEKSVKTIEASHKALQAAEETAQRQLQEAQKRKNTVATIGFKRKPLWFEKFQWFITSDNYLVIAGRDAQQNEQLVKRYLRPGDAYLHADVHGAASCILRAKRQKRQGGKNITLPLSDQALREAGNFTICRSSAWNSRMVTSAWWVESHQVSKTAPTGEYLTVGSFMVRGKKNFLPPTQLEMGLGVLFKLGDDDSIARHKNDRRDFALLQMEEEADMIAHDEEQQIGTVKKNRSSNMQSNAIQEKEDPIIDTPPTMPPEPMEESTKNVGEEKSDGSEPKPGESEIEKRGTEQVHHESGDIKGEDFLKSPPPDTENQNIAEDHGDQHEGEDRSVESVEAKMEPPAKAKKGLSVKERKLIRKYGSLEAAQAAEQERMKQQAKMDTATSKNNKQQQSTASNNNAASTGKRGKKSKMKRAAKKYADQDDEDKELAMLALHAGETSKKGDNKNKTPIISETEKEAAAQTVAILKKDPAVVAERLPIKVREILAKCVSVKTGNEEDAMMTVRWDKFDADVLEQIDTMEQEEEKAAAAQRLLTLKESTRIDNFSASLAGIIRTIRKYGYQGLEESNAQGNDGKRKTKAEKQAEEQSWKQKLAEEGVVDEDLEEDGIDDTIELSKLTGKPHMDDLLLNAIPVCAPYHTLTQYTYRVKLTPGNQKRGKASKQCLELFLKDGQKPSVLSERTKELIKKAGDNEWVQAICGDVKISAAGASKAIQKQKAQKKSKSKNKKK